MRPRRRHGWVVSVQEDETFTVRHGQRDVMTGLRTEAAAIEVVAQHRDLDERAWSEDEEGYRTELTRLLNRRAAQAAVPIRGHEQAVAEPDDPRKARARYLANYGRAKRPGRWL